MNNVLYDVTPWLPQGLTTKFSPWMVSEDCKNNIKCGEQYAILVLFIFGFLRDLFSNNYKYIPSSHQKITFYIDTK